MSRQPLVLSALGSLRTHLGSALRPGPSSQDPHDPLGLPRGLQRPSCLCDTSGASLSSPHAGGTPSKACRRASAEAEGEGPRAPKHTKGALPGPAISTGSLQGDSKSSLFKCNRSKNQSGLVPAVLRSGAGSVVKSERSPLPLS